MKVMAARGRPAEILLVEDNQDDVEITRHGFARSKFLVNLHCVENGKECMQFLHKEGPYEDKPSPDLILLDLNMPVMDGREVLARMARDETVNHIPVVVLTTSSNDQEVVDMYKLRCSSYATKPVDFNDFINVVKGISDFYFTMVVLPSADD